MEYKCMNCSKMVSTDHLRRRIRCVYCGSKMLFKQRSTPTKVLAV